MLNDLNAKALHLALTELDYGFGGTRSLAQGADAPIRPLPGSCFRYRVVKRAMDVSLVMLSSPLWLPLLLLIATTVKLTSPGPVFFLHRRIRQDGSFFSMWKFRTMCVNSAAVLEQHLACFPEARAEWRQTHKLRCDPRVTAVGALLRRFSLDELPQIWNVLRDEMSLVGPRPIVAAEIERYGECFGCYCQVKPGVTGIWQVSGRCSLSYAERVRLDCSYVSRWSLLGDVKILLQTFRSVLKHDGAF